MNHQHHHDHHEASLRRAVGGLVTRTRAAAGLAVGLLALSLCSPVARVDAALAPGVQLKKWYTQAEVPVDMAFFSTERFLYAQSNGEIFICDISSGTFQKQLYLDLTSVTDFIGNKGVQSILLDDEFATTKKIFIYYSRNEIVGPASAAADTHRVSTFLHVENSGGLTSRGDPQSETVLWIDPEGYPTDRDETLHWHFGGKLQFGPDGRIYFAQGDKTFDEFRSQDISTPSGCILRMNKDGTFPADNHGNLMGGYPGIWGAKGLRSPWRSTWDLETGRFIIGDVGGNDQDTAVEEINVYKEELGFVNYAWPLCEGSNCDAIPPDNVYPAYEYAHNGYSACVIGGHVYRDTMFPSLYQGSYIAGEYVLGWLKAFHFDASGLTIVGETIIDDQAPAFISIERGLDGSIWTVDLYGGISQYTHDGSGIGSTSAASTVESSTSETATYTRPTQEPTPPPPPPPGSDTPVTLQFTVEPLGSVEAMTVDDNLVLLPFTLETFIHAWHTFEAPRSYCRDDGTLFVLRGLNWGGPAEQTITAAFDRQNWRLIYDEHSDPVAEGCFPA